MKSFVLFLVAGLVLAGCEKKPEPENTSAAANSSPTVAANSSPTVAASPAPALSNDTVVVSIDGKNLTRGEILARGKTVLLLNMRYLLSPNPHSADRHDCQNRKCVF